MVVHHIVLRQVVAHRFVQVVKLNVKQTLVMMGVIQTKVVLMGVLRQMPVVAAIVVSLLRHVFQILVLRQQDVLHVRIVHRVVEL